MAIYCLSTYYPKKETIEGTDTEVAELRQIKDQQNGYYIFTFSSPPGFWLSKGVLNSLVQDLDLGILEDMMGREFSLFKEKDTQRITAISPVSGI